MEKLALEWITGKPEKVDIKNVYYCETRDVFSARLDKMLGNLLENKKIEEEKVYIISAIAGEIGNNSFDHNLGNWPDVRRQKNASRFYFRKCPSELESKNENKGNLIKI